MPINTLRNFGPDWLRNVVSITLTRFKTAIFNNSSANNFRCYWADFAHYQTHLRSCVYKYFVQVWSRLIEKCGLYCANKVKNSNFQYFRGNSSGVTGQFSLTIELIRDLVPINTSCKFGPDWLRNVVSITLARKVLTDARTTDELPWRNPIWPLASGAKNCDFKSLLLPLPDHVTTAQVADLPSGAVCP